MFTTQAFLRNKFTTFARDMYLLSGTDIDVQTKSQRNPIMIL